MSDGLRSAAWWGLVALVACLGSVARGQGPGDPGDPHAEPCDLAHTVQKVIELPCGGWEGNHIYIWAAPTYYTHACVAGECVKTGSFPYPLGLNSGTYSPPDPPGHPAQGYAPWEFQYLGTGELNECGEGSCCEGQSALYDYWMNDIVWVSCES